MSQAAEARQTESVKSPTYTPQEPEALAHMQDLRKSIALGNRLWMLAFLAILAFTFYLIWSLGKQEHEIQKRETARFGSPHQTSGAHSEP